MVWIKLTHTSGSVYLNLEQVYRYEQTASTEITFYDANSILPTSYTFATAAALTECIAKLTSISKVIDIDQLATQG
jgi:hypothetical protein